MAKTRIHELAKELQITSKELIDKVASLGISVKNHMSTLEDEDVGRLKSMYQDSSDTIIEEKRIGRRVIRRRKIKVREEKPEPEATPEGEVQPEAEKLEVPAEPEISEAVEKETKEVAEKPAEPLKEQKVEKVEAKLKEEAKKVPEPKEPEKPEKARIVKPAAPEKEISEAALEAKIVEKKEELAKKIEKPATKEEEKIKAVKPEPEKPKADAREEALEVSKVEKPEKPPVKPAKKVKKEKKEEAAVIISLPEKPVEPVEKEKEKKEVAEKKTPIDLEEARKARVAKKDKPPVPEKKPALTKKKKGVKIEPFAIPEAKPGKPERRKVVSKEDLYSEAELKTQRIIKSKKGAKAARAEKQFQKPEITVPKAIKRRLKIDEAITVANLAKRMGIAASEVIKKLMELGLMVNVNQSIDFDTAVLVAEEFGFEVEKAAFEEEEILKTESDREEDLKPRPPVVTIMGHVDHGKTSLLDVIRESNITEKEAGGITQHIGAYQVKVDGGEVTFLDTPGHEAFTSMRARGAQVTDLVVLVVAADDGVMQQTIEAINHAKAADIPILVAINKIDKPNANPDRVKRELAEHGLIPEEWGGDTTMVEVSAKKNIGIDDLLEMILLQAEILELKANPNKPARGRIIEAKLDRGRGPVATVLVQEGTLKIGDFFVCGVHHGKVRALFDSNRQRILKATPSMPVEIQGISGVPTAGDDFVVVASEKQAKMISE
ncbi:MAG TPA: translation initiation factor IF-2, partial [Deltaproteobacteria bacterium]|nr:translation initiation factor IF-2 [Deltaproteobacteria bacterium]